MFAGPDQYTPGNLARVALDTLPGDQRTKVGAVGVPLILELLIMVLPEALRLVNNCMERSHPKGVVEGLQRPSLVTQARVRFLVGRATRGRRDYQEVAPQARQALYGLATRATEEDLTQIRGFRA
jgi:hypothetical protein